jgi:hypothetical protein
MVGRGGSTADLAILGGGSSRGPPALMPPALTAAEADEADGAAGIEADGAVPGAESAREGDPGIRDGDFPPTTKRLVGEEVGDGIFGWVEEGLRMACEWEVGGEGRREWEPGVTFGGWPRPNWIG